MTSECPLCQSSLAEDFGLVVCPSCGASLFIEMDGQVRAYESQEAESEKPTNQLDAQIIDEEELSAEEVVFEENPLQESVDFDPENDLIEERALNEENDLIEERTFNEENDLIEEGGLDKEEAEEESFSPIASEEYVSSNEESNVGLEDMSSLADYGNSEGSLGREGPLRVKLHLSGIDSPEIREELREALEDKKFLWDIEEIMRSIEGGVLVIDNATPLKAAILLERIKALPLDVSWEQFAINQP